MIKSLNTPFVKDIDLASMSKFQRSEPTIRAAENFNSSEDAAALRAAMKGLGTDEAAIISILTTKSNKQREKILAKYTEEINRDLIKDLKSELGGKFEDVILALMKPPIEYLCAEINRALDKKDFDALTEIFVTRGDNSKIKQLVEEYEKLYKRPLVEHICDKTSGDYRRLLTLIVTGTRNSPGKVSPEKAKELAAALFEAGEKKAGTDEAEFVKVMGHESYEQLALVFDEYKKLRGRTFEQALKAELSGDLLNITLAIVDCIQSQTTYFAKQLHKAMAGIGTNDNTLIRIIVSRSEIDLGNIKKEYERLYNKTLESAVRSETSGDFKKALLNLIAGNIPGN